MPDTTFGQGDDFSQDVADAIRSSAAATQPGTPEHEFVGLWDAGEDFKGPFNELLQKYYRAFGERLATQEGFDSYMRLAEARRDRVKAMPITESPMLFSRTNIPSGERTMLADGTVEEA